jgi:hypothetical protein
MTRDSEEGKAPDSMVTMARDYSLPTGDVLAAASRYFGALGLREEHKSPITRVFLGSEILATVTVTRSSVAPGRAEVLVTAVAPPSFSDRTEGFLRHLLDYERTPRPTGTGPVQDMRSVAICGSDDVRRE